MSCPTTANNSYPITPISDRGPVYTGTLTSFYSNKEQPVFPIEFIWGPRSIPPTFSNASAALLDDANLDNPATIRYDNKKYNLHTAQITKPYNTSLIPDEAHKSNNKADLTLLFKTDVLVPTTPGSEKYIIVSIPLIYNTTSSSDPVYITGLTSGAGSGPFSLADCLPKSKKFLGYSTCLDGTPTMNALVMIFYDGIQISSTAFASLAQQCNVLNIGTTTWPKLLSPPPDFKLKRDPTIFTETSFNKLIVSEIGSYNVNPTVSKDTSVDSYKCVPLDMNTNLKTGKVITIDPNGKNSAKLSSLLEDRNNVAKETTSTGIKDQTKLDLIISFIVLIVIILIVLFLIWYADPTVGRTSFKINSVYPLASLGVIICIFGGILIGVYMR